jgi:hypothetical protein
MGFLWTQTLYRDTEFVKCNRDVLCCVRLVRDLFYFSIPNRTLPTFHCYWLFYIVTQTKLIP